MNRIEANRILLRREYDEYAKTIGRHSGALRHSLMSFAVDELASRFGGHRLQHAVGVFRRLRPEDELLAEALDRKDAGRADEAVLLELAIDVIRTEVERSLPPDVFREIKADLLRRKATSIVGLAPLFWGTVQVLGVAATIDAEKRAKAARAAQFN